jgi:hypothetical protein
MHILNLDHLMFASPFHKSNLATRRVGKKDRREKDALTNYKIVFEISSREVLQ